MLSFPFAYLPKQGFASCPGSLQVNVSAHLPSCHSAWADWQTWTKFYSRSNRKKSLKTGSWAEKRHPENILWEYPFFFFTRKAKLTSYWAPVNPRERIRKNENPHEVLAQGGSFNQSWQRTTRQSHWKPSSVTSTAYWATRLKYLLPEDLRNLIK